MDADTGFVWDEAWTTIDAAVTLTQGGTVTDISEPISIDGKASCEVSIDADYSNHAKATAGLSAYLLRDVNASDWEAQADEPYCLGEIVFTQNGSNRRTFSISAQDMKNFKLLLVWGNTTTGSSVTVATMIRKSLAHAHSE